MIHRYMITVVLIPRIIIHSKGVSVDISLTTDDNEPELEVHSRSPMTHIPNHIPNQDRIAYF